MDLSVLERYRATFPWLQQQEDVVVQNDHSFANDWSKKHLDLSKLQSFNCLSRTSSSSQLTPPPPSAAAAAVEESGSGGGGGVPLIMETSCGSLRKRKSESVKSKQRSDKRIKGEVKDKSSTENSAETSKGDSKPDFIHVRARRGQATDSHSLAERARREKIGHKMKCLQDLVPGCNKITGKARMLDEIINYVQSLQRQVEFLSMKLATLNPSLDFNTENLLAKELHSCLTSFPAAITHLQLNLAQEESTNCSLNVLMNQSETPCFSQLQQFSSCDSDLQLPSTTTAWGFMRDDIS